MNFEHEEPGEADAPDPEVQSYLGGALGQVMEALDAGPEELEDLSDRLFGSSPEAGLEEAALDHARRTHDAGALDPGPASPGVAPLRMPGHGGRLEEFVRLSFRKAKGEADSAELARLAELERELGATAPRTVDEGGEPLVPEVDAAQFVREWRREHPRDARPDPALTDSGEIAIDPLAGDADDESEDGA